MNIERSLIVCGILVFSQLVHADTPADTQRCPGCLVQMPPIEVTETAAPMRVSYAILASGMEAFKEHRAYAPGADLKFIVQPRSPGEKLSGVTVTLASAGQEVPVKVDKQGVFEMPRLLQPLADESEVVVNRREGVVRLRPYVRTLNSTDSGLRMGDLRMECEIIWAMEMGELSFIARNALKLVGGLCGSSKSKVTFRVDRKLSGANLIMAGRKLALSIDKTGYAYSPPLYDKSWPDDTVVALEFESR